MGRPRLPDPPKTCRTCDAPMTRKMFGPTLEDRAAFARRVYCDQECMAAGMTGVRKVINDRSGHRQASKMVSPACQRCERSGVRLAVHHVDENPTNNAPANLLTLCSSCHRRCHSPNFDPTTGLRRPCSLCSKPAVKKGFCGMHLTRLKKYGDPLMKKRKTSSGWVLERLAEPADSRLP